MKLREVDALIAALLRQNPGLEATTPLGRFVDALGEVSYYLRTSKEVRQAIKRTESKEATP